jgi:hypothetical protein
MVRTLGTFPPEHLASPGDNILRKQAGVLSGMKLSDECWEPGEIVGDRDTLP